MLYIKTETFSTWFSGSGPIKLYYTSQSQNWQNVMLYNENDQSNVVQYSEMKRGNQCHNSV